MKLNIKKIKSEMKRQRLSQSELARRMGAKPQRIHYILNHGARTFAVVMKLARVLGVDGKDLIS